MAVKYWVIAAPREGLADFQCSAETISLKVPEKLRYGSRDNLIAIVDQVSALETHSEQVIRRMYAKLSETKSQLVNQVASKAENIFSDFVWDDNLIDKTKLLSDICTKCSSDLSSCDEQVRNIECSLQEAKLELNNKTRGSELGYVAMPLTLILTPEILDKLQIVNTENLMTFGIVLQKNRISEFIQSYEKLHQSIVPKSQIWLNCRDTDGTELHAITVLRKDFATIKSALIEKKWIVREQVPSPEDILKAQKETLACKNILKEKEFLYIDGLFNEINKAMNIGVHAKVIRCYIESKLRWGLKVDILTLAIKLSGSKENESDLKIKLHQACINCMHGDAQFYSDPSSKDISTDSKDLLVASIIGINPDEYYTRMPGQWNALTKYLVHRTSANAVERTASDNQARYMLRALMGIEDLLFNSSGEATLFQAFASALKAVYKTPWGKHYLEFSQRFVPDSQQDFFKSLCTEEDLSGYLDADNLGPNNSNPYVALAISAFLIQKLVKGANSTGVDYNLLIRQEKEKEAREFLNQLEQGNSGFNDKSNDINCLTEDNQHTDTNEININSISQEIKYLINSRTDLGITDIYIPPETGIPNCLEEFGELAYALCVYFSEDTIINVVEPIILRQAKLRIGAHIFMAKGREFQNFEVSRRVFFAQNVENVEDAGHVGDILWSDQSEQEKFKNEPSYTDDSDNITKDVKHIGIDYMSIIPGEGLELPCITSIRHADISSDILDKPAGDYPYPAPYLNERQCAILITYANKVETEKRDGTPYQAEQIQDVAYFIARSLATHGKSLPKYAAALQFQALYTRCLIDKLKVSFIDRSIMQVNHLLSFSNINGSILNENNAIDILFLLPQFVSPSEVAKESSEIMGLRGAFREASISLVKCRDFGGAALMLAAGSLNSEAYLLIENRCKDLGIPTNSRNIKDFALNCIVIDKVSEEDFITSENDYDSICINHKKCWDRYYTKIHRNQKSNSSFIFEWTSGTLTYSSLLCLIPENNFSSNENNTKEYVTKIPLNLLEEMSCLYMVLLQLTQDLVFAGAIIYLHGYLLYPPALRAFGSALYSVSEFEKASKFLELYISQCPHDSIMRRKYATCYINMGNIDSAFQQLSCAIRDSPESAENWSALAGLHLMRKNENDDKLARECMKRCLYQSHASTEKWIAYLQLCGKLGASHDFTEGLYKIKNRDLSSLFGPGKVMEYCARFTNRGSEYIFNLLSKEYHSYPPFLINIIQFALTRNDITLFFTNYRHLLSRLLISDTELINVTKVLGEAGKIEFENQESQLKNNLSCLVKHIPSLKHICECLEM